MSPYSWFQLVLFFCHLAGIKSSSPRLDRKGQKARCHIMKENIVIVFLIPEIVTSVSFCPCTMVQNNQESGRKYWAICSSIWSHRSLIQFLCTAGFVRTLRLRSFVHSLAHSRACGKVNHWMSQNDLVYFQSALAFLYFSPHRANRGHE